MAVTHLAHPLVTIERHAWTRTTRVRLTSPRAKAFGTLLLLILLGVATGQLLGHLLAAGIESLLDIIAVDQTG